jgi:hypothetical protein
LPVARSDDVLNHGDITRRQIDPVPTPVLDVATGEDAGEGVVGENAGGTDGNSIVAIEREPVEIDSDVAGLDDDAIPGGQRRGREALREILGTPSGDEEVSLVVARRVLEVDRRPRFGAGCG